MMTKKNFCGEKIAADMLMSVGFTKFEGCRVWGSGRVGIEECRSCGGRGCWRAQDYEVVAACWGRRSKHESQC